MPDKLTTVADQIWNEIKDKPLALFALPNQLVHQHCQPAPVDPARCFLLYKASALLPAVESAIGPDYTCETMDKYIVVSRKEKSLV